MSLNIYKTHDKIKLIEQVYEYMSLTYGINVPWDNDRYNTNNWLTKVLNSNRKEPKVYPIKKLNMLWLLLVYEIKKS